MSEKIKFREGWISYLQLEEGYDLYNKSVAHRAKILKKNQQSIALNKKRRKQGKSMLRLKYQHEPWSNKLHLKERHHQSRLVDRPPEEWREALERLPLIERSKVASIIWWEYKSKAIRTADWSFLDQYTTNEPIEIPQEQLAIALYRCGYSAHKAVSASLPAQAVKEMNDRDKEKEEVVA